MNNKQVVTFNIFIIYFFSFFVTGNIFGQVKTDNAAILYYQALLVCPDEDTISDEFIRFGYGYSDSTPKLLQFNIETNKNLIKLFTRATEIQECNWLIRDHNIGDEIRNQINVRRTNLNALIGAYARNCALNGDYINAFDKCRTLLQFTKHLELLENDVFLIRDINTKAFLCISKILDIMPSDENNLQYIKKLLSEYEKEIRQSLKIMMFKELESLMEQVSEIDLKQQIKYQPIKDPNYENYKKELMNMNNEDIVKIIHQDLKKYLNSIFATIENNKSYGQTYIKIEDIEKNYEKQIENNPTITWGIKPAIEGFALTFGTLYTLNIRYLSQFYSLEDAIEIYLVKARTGQLPKQLPQGLAKDPYSGQDFEYILTENGFKLRCREKDVRTNIFSEFEFKSGALI